jgi:hypothetical protein
VCRSRTIHVVRTVHSAGVFLNQSTRNSRKFYSDSYQQAAGGTAILSIQTDKNQTDNFDRISDAIKKVIFWGSVGSNYENDCYLGMTSRSFILVSVSEKFVAGILKVHFYHEDGGSMFLQNTGNTFTKSISTNKFTIVYTYHVFYR